MKKIFVLIAVLLLAANTAYAFSVKKYAGSSSINISEDVSNTFVSVDKVEVRLTFSPAITSGNIIIKIDSGLGTEYDFILRNIDVAEEGGISTYNKVFENFILPKDKVNINFTNPGGSNYTALIIW